MISCFHNKRVGEQCIIQLHGECTAADRHGLVATIVVRQIFNEDKNLSQQIHEDKRQKDKC